MLSYFVVFLKDVALTGVLSESSPLFKLVRRTRVVTDPKEVHMKWTPWNLTCSTVESKRRKEINSFFNLLTKIT
jgi:hypothetical protein